MESLADYLLSCIHYAGISQRELAKQSGVSAAEISRLVNSQRLQPTVKILAALARVLHADLDEFLRRAGYPVNVGMRVDTRVQSERSVVKYRPAQDQMSGFFPVPVLGTIKAGAGGVAHEEILGYEFEPMPV